jgi:hypothetical protein
LLAAFWLKGVADQLFLGIVREELVVVVDLSVLCVHLIPFIIDELHDFLKA